MGRDPMSYYDQPEAELFEIEPRPSARKHAGLGIASFVVGLVAVVEMVVMFGIVVAVLGQSPDGLVDESSPTVMLVGLLALSGGFLSLIGAGLAVGGLAFQKDRRHIFDVLGLVLNGGLILSVVGLMALGAVADVGP